MPRLTSERELRQPNLFELSGDGIHISYSTSSLIGPPQLTYQDAHQSHVFIGDQIKTTETEIGSLVSVVIQRTVDRDSTTFTLLIPKVNLRFEERAQIATLGITTLHKTSVIGPPDGQGDVYTVHDLKGTGMFVYT